MTNAAASHDFTSMSNFLLPTGPLLEEEEADPWSPSKRHSDNSWFFTSAGLFVCVLDICPTFLCHLLQLPLIESLLPLLFLCSLTFSSELKILPFLFAVDQIIHRFELL